jgi:hypothetical protein
MALPQNPDSLTAGDRALLEASYAQTKTLKEQTKVLHKLSDAIMNNQNDFTQLRKDIQENQRKFFEGETKGFSEIKKFFEKQKGKTGPGSPGFSSNFGKDKDKDSTQQGFFKNTLGKLFGPSKYQQKLMEDTAAIRDISELTRIDISFIKKQYEEPARARERELLAKAIADKMDGGGGGGGLLSLLGGLLSGVGSIIGGAISGLATIIAALAPAVIAALAALGKKLAGVLDSLLDWSKKGVASAQSCCNSKGVDMPDDERKKGGKTGKGGKMGAPALPSPDAKGPALPNDQKRLPGPAGSIPEKTSDINEKMRQNRQDKLGGVTDVKPKGEGFKMGNVLEKAASGGLAGRLLGWPGAALGAIAAAGYEIAQEIMDNDEDFQKSKVKKEQDRLRGLHEKSIKEGTAASSKENKADQVNPMEPKDYVAKQNLAGLKAMLEDELGAKFMKANKDYFDQFGEISINGEKVNLLPNLGTAAGKTLDDAMNTGKALYEAGKAGVAGVNNYISQVQNAIAPSQPAPVIMPSAPAVNNNSAIQQMLNGGVVIGGRRYY